MCFSVGLGGFILVGTFCASWTCMSISSTKLGKFSVNIFSNRFSISCSLSLLLPTPPWCECWNAWSCPRGSSHYPHFFFWFLLLLVILIGYFLLPYISNCWVDSRLHPLYHWFLLKCSFFSISVSFISDWILFMLLKLSLSSLSILTTSVLNFASILLVYILLSSFSGVLFCYFIWSMYFVSSFGSLPVFLCIIK